jgi:hypothetical protein
LGAIAALTALYHHATIGGSYFTGVSLAPYNLWVQSLTPYPEPVWSHMLSSHRDASSLLKPSLSSLNHLSNFDVVSKATIGSMKILHPRLFEGKYMFEMEAPGFGVWLRVVDRLLV